eukprot:scaffold1954_cov268-Pinguiococcus_pyrenoidosus.AAC.192
MIYKLDSMDKRKGLKMGTGLQNHPPTRWRRPAISTEPPSIHAEIRHDFRASSRRSPGSRPPSSSGYKDRPLEEARVHDLCPRSPESRRLGIPSWPARSLPQSEAAWPSLQRIATPPRFAHGTLQALARLRPGTLADPRPRTATLTAGLDGIRRRLGCCSLSHIFALGASSHLALHPSVQLIARWAAPARLDAAGRFGRWPL